METGRESPSEAPKQQHLKRAEQALNGQALGRPRASRAQPPRCPLPRMKPAGSVNDVALDALDLDRMKQVGGSVWRV